MESVKRLEEACRDVQKELRSIEGVANGIKVSNDILQNKFQSLTNEVSELQTRKRELEEKLSAMESDKQREWRDKTAAIESREEELRNLQAKAIAQTAEYERRAEEAKSAQEKYELLSSQYQEKLNEVREKARRLQEVAGA